MTAGSELGITVLFVIALTLLVLVTLGVGYLTFLDWREKRRHSK